MCTSAHKSEPCRTYKWVNVSCCTREWVTSSQSCRTWECTHTHTHTHTHARVDGSCCTCECGTSGDHIAHMNEFMSPVAHQSESQAVSHVAHVNSWMSHVAYAHASQAVIMRICAYSNYRSLLQNIVSFIGLFCEWVTSGDHEDMRVWGGVATISRLLKFLQNIVSFIGLFCKRYLQFQGAYSRSDHEDTRVWGGYDL